MKGRPGQETRGVGWGGELNSEQKRASLNKVRVGNNNNHSKKRHVSTHFRRCPPSSRLGGSGVSSVDTVTDTGKSKWVWVTHREKVVGCVEW